MLTHEYFAGNRNRHPETRPKEIDVLADWLNVYREEMWDRQIEANELLKKAKG